MSISILIIFDDNSYKICTPSRWLMNSRTKYAI